jgi:hypothetical protein
LSSSNVSCAGKSDGTASITPIGGTAPYTYWWSPAPVSGQATNSVSGLSAGDYLVQVTDSNGCSRTAKVVITSPQAISVDPLVINASCGSNNGSITLNASGGSGTYTYNWISPVLPSKANQDSLTQGVYRVVVSDGSCSDTMLIAVNDINGPSITVSTTDVSCNGGSTGSASVTATGGTAPYTYSWSSGSSINTADNLSAGTYSVTVSDNIGCKSSSVIDIKEPTMLSLALPATIDASCDASCDGQAVAMPIGGSFPYTYSWTGGSTKSTATNLCSGSNTITVTDANGCKASQSFSINSLNSLLANVISTTCELFAKPVTPVPPAPM